MTDMLEQALAKNYLSDFEIRLNKHILPHIMSFDLMGVEVGVSPNGTTVFLEKGVKTGKIVKNEPEICYSLSSSLYSVKSKLLDTIIKIGNCEEEEVGVMYERALQHYYENVSDSKLDSLGKTIAAEFDKVIVKDIHKSAIIVDEPIDIGEMNVSNMSFVLTSLIHTRGRLPIYLDTVRGFGNHMLCSKLVYDFINENDACHNIPHIIYDGLSNENEEDQYCTVFYNGINSFDSGIKVILYQLAVPVVGHTIIDGEWSIILNFKTRYDLIGNNCEMFNNSNTYYRKIQIKGLKKA